MTMLDSKLNWADIGENESEQAARSAGRFLTRAKSVKKRETALGGANLLRGSVYLPGGRQGRK